MTSTIKKDFGAGGAGLTPGGSSGSPDLATILRDIADSLGNLQPATVSASAAGSTTSTDATTVSAPSAVASSVPDVGETYGVADGFIAGAPTTPSSQAADPGGETDWNVNISAGYAFVNAIGKYLDAQVDLNVSTGSKLMDIGQAMYAWIVLAEAAGVVTQVVVLGTAAVLGVETIPSDADITTGVGHARWTKIALCHASRTADTVVATTEDPSYMQKWGGAGTTLLNDLKAKYNAVVTLANALKTTVNVLVTLADEIKSDYNGCVTLVNELRTKAIAMATAAINIVSG